jgi:hypothetical protein
LWKSEKWFIDYAHYVAAMGLFVCIVVVAVANALRREGNQPGGTSALGQALNAVGAAGGVLIRSPRRFDRYAWLAWLMVGTAAVMGVLLFFHVTSFFWLEIVVALLFAVFWMVQTIEQLPQRAPAGST